MALSNQHKTEIAEQQAQRNTTKRVTSPDLEKILYEAIPVEIDLLRPYDIKTLGFI